MFDRKSSATKAIRQEAGQVLSASVHLGSEGQAENADVTVPMVRADHFIDAKVRGYGYVTPLTFPLALCLQGTWKITNVDRFRALQISFNFQGGTNLIINSLGPVYTITEKKNKWFSFRNQKKLNAKKSQVRKITNKSVQVK